MATRKTVPKLLYHYTSHQAFWSILQSCEFWAHDYRLANDSREVTYASGLIKLGLDRITHKKYKDIIDDILAVFGHPFDPFELRGHSGYIAIASFSEEPNQLSQWRAYAPSSGYSLGFSREALFHLAGQQGFESGRVIYEFEKQNAFIRKRLLEFLEKEIIARSNEMSDPLDGIARFSDFFARLAPLIKHESFHEEREWRIFRSASASDVKFYSGTASIRPYVPLLLGQATKPIPSLKEILVGPSDDQNSLRGWTIDLLRNRNYEVTHRRNQDGLSVFISGSPYRLARR